MKALSNKVVRDLYLFVEPVKYNLNQVVFQEGMRADYVVFVRKGQFELSRFFTRQDDCHLNGKLGGGCLNTQTEMVKKGDNYEKVVKKDEDFIVKSFIKDDNHSRRTLCAGDFFRKTLVLPKKHITTPCEENKKHKL